MYVHMCIILQLLNAAKGSPHDEFQYQNAKQNAHVCFKTLFKDQTNLGEGIGVLDTKGIFAKTTTVKSLI